MKKLILGLALSAAVLPAFSQDVDKLIKEQDVKKIISTLASDEFEGRGNFQPGLEKAAKFIENDFKSIGLEPLPGNKDFRQRFSLYRTKTTSAQVSINGTAVPAEQVAALTGESFSWKDNADVQVVKIAAGKTPQAEFRAVRQSGKKSLVIFDQSFERYFKRLKQAADEGTAGIKQSNQQIVAVLGSFDDVKLFTANVEAKTESLPLANIAGMIKGKSKPDEYVVFSGHYDHLGIIKPMEGDSIANGADDDASGTTAVMSLARYYKKLNNNARSIIFVAFTAEEIGEYGSAYFATQVDPAKVMAMFNIEMIGKASKFGENSAFITGYNRSDFGEILQKNLQGTKFKFYPDPYPEQDLFYRSDNASLARVGVPAHTISTDQIDVDKFYHTVKDELSTLDVNNITATIRAIALSSKTIIDGTDTPKRIPPLER
ncbi:M20/M25/M40 family metallo-hydrolase [Mucilaginibacter sp. RS28]|uniref:M20/M25/M40 family metallo-hydrolase n=1 Tax=Mucilaginibacter straminoryzae TaxID=2932774 RepID=A0A9X1X4P3_9SPHI|nr:M20/M25/M40 family metallo-hydrolase [Mucilaginibacter straminoryzae]MCJ8210501.1 M20/M25/M40 family metallo-hydrolase [Mucilaginibacter straminoryzae]